MKIFYSVLFNLVLLCFNSYATILPSEQERASGIDKWEEINPAESKTEKAAPGVSKLNGEEILSKNSAFSNSIVPWVMGSIILMGGEE